MTQSASYCGSSTSSTESAVPRAKNLLAGGDPIFQSQLSYGLAGNAGIAAKNAAIAFPVGLSGTDYSFGGSSRGTIGELAKSGPVGRSTIYNSIASGRLRTRKSGGRTIVLDEDWRAFPTSTPIMAPAKSAVALTAAPRRPRGRPCKSPVHPITEPVEAPAAPRASRRTVQAPHTPGPSGARS